MSVYELFSLDGKVALVTGGAGLYGKFISEALAEAGAIVYIASRDEEKCKTFASLLSQRGYTVFGGKLDQGDEKSVIDLYNRIINEQGKVDILVNNALLKAMKSYNDPIEGFKLSMEVNAAGTFFITRVFSQNMIERRSGSIINIASIHGIVGPDFTLYEGTEMDVSPEYFFHKSGLINLTRYLASKLGPYNIRVNAISPGGLFANQNPIFVERYNKRTFLGRMAKGEDIKGAVVFLASDASLYVTGANIVVDGGYTAK
ncbi:MAG TPA: SDR family oxidoreductase [bacterium]|nr:SDR family oxidoreductase [bacterium]